MRALPEDLAHALAAEYVVGTLRGAARRRFEAIAAADPRVADIVRLWEARFTPLAEAVAPVEPPARVWRAIAARTAGPAPAARPAGLWANLAFWRGFGLIAGGLATVLLASFLTLAPGTRGDPMLVAVLTAPDSAPRMVVSVHAPDVLRVRMVKPWKDAQGKSLELWVLPKEGAPRSLGLVANAMGDTMMRIPMDDPRLRGADALAVSLEPAGGSPTRQPTGPVLCKGMVAPVRQA